MAHSHPVLVVDDDYTIQTIISHILDQAGLTPVTCEDGELAIEMINVLEFKLVILDLTLPKVDGWNVLSTILASSPSTSILVITGTVTPQTEKFKNENFERDDIDVYYKPIVDREEFISIVQGLVRGALRKDADNTANQFIE
ncbi:MAG: response regulator [Lentisphaerales bacterium]|nr:response regulator [Lentisphaerales bacterium]